MEGWGPYRAGSAERPGRCLWCGTTGPEGQPCRTCSVVVAPRDEQSRPSSGCPRCGCALSLVALEQGTFVFACGACRGVLVPPRAWARLGEQPELARILTSTAQPPSPAKLSLLPCPVCHVEMERGCFAATSNIVIDVCTRTHGLWLDAGELAGVLAYADHRAQVGAAKAQQEAERQWDRAVARAPHVQMAIDLESARIKADSAQRMWRAKRVALAMGAAVFMLRVVLWMARAHDRQAHQAPDPGPTVDRIVGAR